MAQSDRQYECVVFGATGYTGKYTCEHITAALPTDFKWAIAGRSESKLQDLATDLQKQNPDRAAPGIETSDLSKTQLLALAKKTKVLITCVGPYHLYGSAVVAACAETGTHYLDVTGEVPWHNDMVRKYHETAQRSGAIIIPQNGIESAPADLLAWALVQHIRSTLGTATAECIVSLHDLKAVPSGGTLATVLTLLDSYSLSEVAKSQDPWCLSPVPAPQTSATAPKPLLERVTGVRTVSDLGTLIDSLSGPADVSLVNRSWGLIDGGKFYGPRFRMLAYARARNTLQGFFTHLALTFGVLALLLPPVRWALMRFVTQPGGGPSREAVKNDFAEWRAIAHPDTEDQADAKRAFARMYWPGSMYYLTGVCLAEAALTLSRSKTLAHELGGGLLTPACLGESYLERLKKAGLKVEVRTMP